MNDETRQQIVVPEKPEDDLTGPLYVFQHLGIVTCMIT